MSKWFKKIWADYHCSLSLPMQNVGSSKWKEVCSSFRQNGRFLYTSYVGRFDYEKFAWIQNAFGQIHWRKISPQLLNIMTSPLAQEVLESWTDGVWNGTLENGIAFFTNSLLCTCYHPFSETGCSIWPFLIILVYPQPCPGLYTIFFVSKHKCVMLLLLPWYCWYKGLCPASWWINIPEDICH